MSMYNERREQDGSVNNPSFACGHCCCARLTLDPFRALSISRDAADLVTVHSSNHAFNISEDSSFSIFGSSQGGGSKASGNKYPEIRTRVSSNVWGCDG